MTVNATIEKFGYPATLISEYDNWIVMLRPQQATLGALILACKEDSESFGEISPQASAELVRVVRDIEDTLSSAFDYSKINYLMLMMVDPHVHFHILPRYAVAPDFGANTFSDTAWPGPPRLDQFTDIGAPEFEDLLQHLIGAWPEVGR
jgi:diadenosine tetraphosphate (Ap4A) HIT family hydrolase